MLMGAFSYIGDITSEEHRTIRIGIANTFFSIGIPIAMSLGGILLRFEAQNLNFFENFHFMFRIVGFNGVFVISVVIHFIAFTYGLFFIEESPARVTKKSQKSFLLDFFDPSNAIETFKIIAKSGKRLQIGILLIVVILVVGPSHGEAAVFYLFTRFKFQWNEIDFSIYSTYSTILTMSGGLRN